jgi:hypothetical protein
LGNVSNSYAQRWDYQTRGHLYAKINSYTEKTPTNYGQQTRLQFEQSINMGKKFSALNQLRATSNSLNSDLAPTSNLPKKDTFETYLGENYFKYKSSNWVALLGYQEVVWGEAFGLNYADVINPKDQRETLYSEASEARFPLLLFNGKRFFSLGDLTGSLQFLYSPEPRFTKTLPIQTLIGSHFDNFNVEVSKEKTPEIFKQTEWGGRLAGSYAGFDFSAFTFSYIDRDPYYTIKATTTTSLTLKETHSKVTTTGVAFAKSFFDYVVRTDLVLTDNKSINYLDNSMLKSYTSKSLNTVVSVDSPTYNDFSGVFIFAQSSLSDYKTNTFRDKNERFFIGKIAKNLGNDKTLEFTYTHELIHSGHSIQSFINWPINNTTDLKFGGQFYFGDEAGLLNKYKNISSLFFSLKNYFQL